MRIRAIKSAMKRWIRGEDGSATVEVVLWFPILIAVLALVVDVTLMFHGKTQITRVVQDGTRAYAVGRLTQTEDVELFIEGTISALAPHADARTESSGGIVRTVVSIPASDLLMFGTFSAFTDLQLAVTSQHLLEI